MKLPLLLLLLYSRIFALSDVTGQNLYVKGKAMYGDSTIKVGNAIDITTKTTTGPVQNGLCVEPTFNGAGDGVNGAFIQNRIRGFSRYPSTLLLKTMAFDSSGSCQDGVMLDIMDAYGCGSSNRAIMTRKGAVLLGDTLMAARLIQEGGGLQLHATLNRKGRPISADTDHILIFYPDTAIIHDTLPLTSLCLGCDYWFIQYQVGITLPLVIVAHAGDKIETYDSVSLASNKGVSYIHIFGQGDRWRVLVHHEEGAFLSNLGGISDTAQDTGFYTLDNLVEVKAHVRRLLGTSNIAGATMSIFGLTHAFTDSTADTTLAATAATVGNDSGLVVPMTCLMFMNGSGIRCIKDNGANYNNVLRKGTLYGMDFVGRLPRPPRHR